MVTILLDEMIWNIVSAKWNVTCPFTAQCFIGRQAELPSSVAFAVVKIGAFEPDHEAEGSNRRPNLLLTTMLNIQTSSEIVANDSPRRIFRDIAIRVFRD